MFNELFVEQERIEVNEMLDLLDSKLIRAKHEYSKCDVESYNASSWRKYIYSLEEAIRFLKRIIK